MYAEKEKGNEGTREYPKNREGPTDSRRVGSAERSKATGGRAHSRSIKGAGAEGSPTCNVYLCVFSQLSHGQHPVTKCSTRRHFFF